MDKNYYLLGIGGISMSALAIFLKNDGNLVSGYDAKQSENTKMLEENGINVDIKLNKKKIDDADEIVCSSAIKNDNKILDYARRKNKKICVRGQILGEISEKYEKVIAISGAHGKTTTTALIYEILKKAKMEPSLHLGGRRIEDGKNYVLGKKKIFVTEACEYCDNFLFLHPYIAVVTNIEKEHMDFFGTFERELQSFEKFKSQSQVVIEKDEKYCARNVKHDKNGGLIFDLCIGKEKLMHLHLHICEEVNTENCIYAYRVAKQLGVSDEDIKTALENFQGVKTRFERKKSPKFKTVVFDYAHHPTEIEKSIKSAQKIFKGKDLVVVFQPHTFSRTKLLLPQFLEVFEKVKVIFFKTYSARESEKDGLSAKTLTQIVKKKNINCEYADNKEVLIQKLEKMPKNTVLLVLGAGDLQEILHKKKFVT